MTESHAAVLTERDGAVATVTLTTASLTTAAKQALLAALTGLADDPTIRAVVLTGSGRMFCAGQDLVEHATALNHDASTALFTVADHYNPIIECLTAMAKPVIAAINGVCAGAAIGLALACDVRIAADEATFVTAFTGIGLVPDSGLSKTLADAVGLARASELLLTNDKFSAAHALAWGLVGRTVPRDQLTVATAELAQKLANGPTLAFAATKALLRSGRTQTITETLAAESAAQIAMGTTSDHSGAVAAFLAKQAPTFTGR